MATAERLPGSCRSQALDSARGLTAVVVAVHHFLLVKGAQHRPVYEFSSHASVPFLFLLSSFLLSKQYMRGATPRYWAFLSRRLFRLYPSYVAALLLSVLGDLRWHGRHHSPVFTGDTWADPVRGSLILKHLLLLGNYDSSQLNIAIWTMTTEMRFVIIFPLLFAALRVLPTFAVIAGAILTECAGAVCRRVQAGA